VVAREPADPAEEAHVARWNRGERKLVQSSTKGQGA
jgi:hypothetical protein